MINVALIGLGPHAKRIYINYFKKHKINVSLLVDLKSQENNIKYYLLNNGLKKAYFYGINDEYKDNEHLTKKDSDNLLKLCKKLNITHIIIATEPKAHYSYIEFALKNNIHVLTDKPVTVTKNMTSLKNIKKIKKQYYQILRMSKNSNVMCNVMCQRQYHKGYVYIKKILEDIVVKYQVPITHIDIYHSDGNWEMMHDLDKENHPYKYGYGKLFHSGYHFIDLLSDILKINNQLPENKKIKNGEVYSNCLTPNDEKAIINIDDYKRLFKKQDIPKYYYENSNPSFDCYGEKNFYSLMKFTNKFNQLITEVNLNLLHYGFSRRGWIQSKNYYKENGRIRHERINIHIGPLMNIQVHSYQSKEIKDRADNLAEEQIGGLEHFEIHIYRNIDMIGGKPFEKINLGDLYTNKEKKEFLGYNELSREQYLNNFFKGKCDKGDIREQKLGIEILCLCAKGIYNHYNNIKYPERISTKNTMPIKIEYLKRYSNNKYRNIEKDLLKQYITKKDDFEIGVNLFKQVNSKYEVNMFISSNKKTIGKLLLKINKEKNIMLLYYYCLIFLISFISTKIIIKIIEHK